MAVWWLFGESGCMHGCSVELNGAMVGGAVVMRRSNMEVRFGL